MQDNLDQSMMIDPETKLAIYTLVNFAEAYSVCQTHTLDVTDARAELVELTESLLWQLTGSEPSQLEIDTVLPY